MSLGCVFKYHYKHNQYRVRPSYSISLHNINQLFSLSVLYYQMTEVRPIVILQWPFGQCVGEGKTVLWHLNTVNIG